MNIAVDVLDIQARESIKDMVKLVNFGVHTIDP
jgi:hypothetical protein